ncbi:6-phosphogluconolactonase [Xenorhabdus nematophila]|uniref:6-phosphogluconolactonase n=1 Tax=Xenorhabdus nematophila TaxID=628 RepID=UPI000542B1DF|nr:6-phosphogluconolactonase [Xenorhabdus nematophila]CEF33454.1 putative isomerase [Xenorhabdus nematophila str. Websteri]AYA39711.1 6-phosphogluconolactonase [Xenorhabdus nematophila]MBA0018282.1 6-phosphogluconolactonase [Xenorhabdus nematophila]MCB4425863.1 6-phosphogluconolactonase [Xenorhabdus nematophila]QNJ37360.1 6-phosphogluconolactonase [Xenorhabdus nematophila]
MKQVVYTASPNSRQIHIWSLNVEGGLSLLQTVDVPGEVQPMVINPDGKHLYVGIRPQFSIVTYAIGENGSLEQKSIAPLPGSPTHISTDRAGRFLFSASYSFNNLSVHPIDDQGNVKAPIQIVENLQAPHSANIDRENRQLLVPCLKEDHIRIFNMDNQGYLVESHADAITTETGAGPRHMAFHPKKQAIYCINELDSTVDVLRKWEKYRIVQSVDSLPADFSSVRWSADIHMTPDGRHLYTSERSESLISHFRVSEEGYHLTLAGHYLTETQPRGFAIDHSGHFLIASGQKSDHISVSRIDKFSGELTQLARYPVGKSPMWVTILAL